MPTDEERATFKRSEYERIKPAFLTTEDDQEYLAMVEAWGQALRERDEARDYACRLEAMVAMLMSPMMATKERRDEEVQP